MLESQCSWRRYRLGERVFDHGSTGRDVYFVIDGSVSVINFSASGREVGFASAEAGGMFGEMAAIDGEARSASVVASADSWIAVLPPEQFIALLRQHADMTLALLRRLSVKVRQVGERVMEMVSLEAAGRVYAELLRRASPDPSIPELWVVENLPPLRELARSASVNRDEASRALSDLYPSGILRRKGEALYLTDRKALEEIIATSKPSSGPLGQEGC